MTATSQVITGLRRILREQLNRRFAFGVTLCKANFRVWLCDRSGLVGMRSSIDMDKNPKAFIRVMAAFSILRPEELGWDPTMRIYRSPTVSLLPYLVDFEIENYNDSVYHTRWAIEMPGKEPHTRETFITVKCLSAAQADGDDGRGTIVWEAVRKEEIGDPKELFVLKQSWYPSDDVATRQLYSEAQMYKRVSKHLETLENLTTTAASCQMSSGDPDVSDQFNFENIKVLHDVREALLREASTEDKQYISDVYSSEDVCINGETDTTFTLIRRKLALYEYNAKSKAGAKRDREKITEETRLYGILIEGDKVRYSSGATRTVSRTHNRLLQSTHGWPIKFFLDLKELLQVLRDGIKGHKFLYLLCWILHRDISMGNIVISAPLSYDPEKDTTIGRLIDLDHAKAANRVHPLYPLIQEADAKTGGDGVEEPNYGTESEVVRGLVSLGVDAKVACIICHRILEDKPDMNSEGLLNAAFSYITPKRGPIVDRIAAQKPVCRPDFQSIPSRQYERTGTVPFMSAEVMLGEHQLIHQCHEERLTKFTHHAVHDVESFFWVLLYICLTRKGPGGARRDELNHVECPNEYTKTLRHIILCLFNAEWANVAQNKTKVLKSQELLENNIIPYIHGYFEDVRSLIKKWHALLQRAHRYHLVERDAIHDQSLELIEETLVEVEKKAGEEHELTKKERERRKAEMTRILKTCRDTSKSSSTGPHTEVAPSTPPQHDRTLPFDRTPQTSAAGGTNAELTVAQRPKSPESPLAKRSKTGNAGTLHRID
ncbi:hypothetical protein QCA50_010262 [Cerrena zonata]|uniref:Fungal-type protein kinase domain-containing protein n=1 Tax=Cerrena zonata TaxID=2478898 RepID=A0AAW0G2R1_9APHY